MSPLPLFLGAGALIALAISKGGDGSPPASPRTSKGSRLFTGTYTSDLTTFHLVNGEVQESPEQITAQISAKLGKALTVGVVALATMLASESGGAPDSIRAALAWTAMNRMKYPKRWGNTLPAVLIPNGRFGVQGTGRREFATRKPPTRRDLNVAMKVASGQIKDPTKGSVFFDHPSAQRAFVAQNAEYYGKSPEAIAAQRIADGHQMVTLPGVSPNYLRFWA